MQKTGLKTFVCSFILSLFMIFAINGVFWRVAPQKSREIKIPHKNIMLFVNSNLTSPSTRPVPVKKIALSVLNEPQNAQAEPLKVKQEPKIIKADIFDDMRMIEIPLEIVPAMEEIKPQAKKVAKRANPSPPAPPQKAIERIAIAPSPPEIKLAKIEANIPLETNKKSLNKPQENAVIRVSEPNEEERKPLYLLPKPAQAPKPVQIAQEDGPKSIIPLQHYNEQIAADKQIKVINSAEPNQVALTDASVPIKSMVKNDTPSAVANEPEKKADKWQKMSGQAEGRNSDSPWVVAKSKSKTSNNLLLQEEYFTKDVDDIKAALKQPEAAQSDDETLLASETIKNLLIPIPEDILNDENLTPQLVSSQKPEEMKKEAEIEAKMTSEKKEASLKEDSGFVMKKIEEPTKSAIKQNTPLTTNEADGKSSILTSLSSIFSSPTNVKEIKNTNNEKNSGLVQGFKNKFKPQKARNKIMPTEMRLSFQPNRAEISGQTLRWIQAFATKTAEDKTLLLEIRIDGTSAMDLQQKRLNLLHNILTNRGVEYSKINTVFTNREPNSFIIRTIKINNSGTMENGNYNQDNTRQYMQW